MATVDLVYDPYDYAIDADPHPVWKRLRDEAPVYYNEHHGFYALSRFDDVLNAHLDPATFSSAHTTVLEMMAPEIGPYEQSLMIFMDPPQHTRYRKLVSRAFTPRHISNVEPRVRELATGFLDQYVGADEFDYVADFGARLPVMVISALLGAPREDEAQLREWTDEMLHIEPGEMMGERASDIRRMVYEYWQHHIDERRRRPRDDIMSELIAAELEEADGSTRHLTDEELHAFYGLISSAGNETVARFLGFAAIGLDRFPGERRKLVDDPSLIPNAVEEILRWEAPSPIQGRWTTRDVALHGTVIPKDSKVALLTGAANRDERAFPDPDVIDVDRKITRHVAFGYGIHFCLGAALARLEGRVALEETLRRFPEWTVDQTRCEMVHTSTVRGYAKVPIAPRAR
jgi:cytochrome P450